eukprot:321660_1
MNDITAVTIVTITLMIVHLFIQLISGFIHWTYWCEFQHVFLFSYQWNVLKAISFFVIILVIRNVTQKRSIQIIWHHWNTSRSDHYAINKEFSIYFIDYHLKYTSIFSFCLLFGIWSIFYG